MPSLRNLGSALTQNAPVSCACFRVVVRPSISKQPPGSPSRPVPSERRRLSPSPRCRHSNPLAALPAQLRPPHDRAAGAASRATKRPNHFVAKHSMAGRERGNSAGPSELGGPMRACDELGEGLLRHVSRWLSPRAWPRARALRSGAALIRRPNAGFALTVHSLHRVAAPETDQRLSLDASVAVSRDGYSLQSCTRPPRPAPSTRLRRASDDPATRAAPSSPDSLSLAPD